MDTGILEVYDRRRNKVVKANELIQKSRFNLTLQQQKVVLYLISRIKPTDEDFQEYEFSISDFCRVCGISETSGKNYQALKNAIKEIADKSLWIDCDKGETLIRWIEKPYINKQSGTVRIRLDADMKPYLLQLKKNFTEYELIWTLNFKSKYTIRLYELIKSIHYREMETYEREFSLTDLRKLLDAEKYDTYQNFKARVLNPAVNEINSASDKVVSYTPIKNGKSVVSIRFAIGTKPPTETYLLQEQIEQQFGLNQLTFWNDTGEMNCGN